MKVPFINLDFFFEGNVVGLFDGFKYPTKDGEYRYEPYRGFGHLKMWESIKEKGFAICFYEKENEKVFFKVKDSGKYRKLIFCDFRQEIIQN